MLGERLVAEVVVRSAGREDQRVVADLVAVGANGARVQVHAGHRRLAEADVGRLPERASQRECDIRWIQQRRGHLIKQRREKVIVVPVEQRDAGIGAVECARTREAAEAAPDDHDAL